MTYVTFGGVTVGICILIATLVKWWPGKALQKDPLRHVGRLLPFLIGWAYGVLVILGIGGIIGWAARTALWITSWLGDVALVWGVGTEAGQRAGGAVYLPLTQTGGGIVFILTVAIVVAIKKSSKYGGDLLMGTWCGVTLGTSAGVAGFAAVPLAQGANWLGATVYGAL
ncbi:hypothetical protein [Streptomyces kebangsaanensis]|uniref:hypothetical protein n=1 Tax=Streptomyces kebangsaanensis TaxID=864058 RepID=UPI00093AA2BA|nr:hypothetical protein [Streptomyces kebangsaanensis]